MDLGGEKYLVHAVGWPVKVKIDTIVGDYAKFIELRP